MYRLSREMGIPVSELEHRISSNELVYYAASYQLYPSIGDLMDVQTAVLCAVNSEGKTVADFLPDRFKDHEPDEEAQAVAANFANVIAMQNQLGKITKEK